MAKFYLKDLKSAMGSEPLFCDEQEVLLYQTRLTEFIAPMDCCAGTVHLPDKYKLFSADRTALSEVARVKMKLMPEFEAFDLQGNVLVCTVKKKFSLFKVPLEITSKTGTWVVDGNVFKRNFRVLGEHGVEVFSMKPDKMPWGEAFVIEFDGDEFEEYIVATMILAIESAYQTGS